MNIINLTLIGILIQISLTMQLTLQLVSDEKQCFYSILQSQQKYLVDATPKNKVKYELQISAMIDNVWENIFYKMATQPYENMNIHKLASSSSTYSICFKNIETQILYLRIKIQSGLALLQFELLPDSTDSDNLQRELHWLRIQKQGLFQNIARMEGIKSTTQGLVNIMSTKMIGFAIIGLISIIVVNFIFYQEIKKIFKERKII